MLANLFIGSAWAADGGAQHEGGVLSSPETWVAVAFLLFIVLIGRILYAKITEMLDKRSAGIAKSLADAEKLRAEALNAKADAEKTLAQATAEAEAILSQAREEVRRMQARAAQSLENAIALREQQALDRIAQSEAAAAKQVRDAAVDIALTATRSLLREKVGSDGAGVEESIAELPRRLQH
ncbi:MAG TPA: ATP synthase F0 subunit B [Reyranella sp.]|jgi:F-type H+-transporting ATPase subunit b|nr:ATP synthase F0 subunit B [Reyranella sp.]